jgi:hypothetical protein
VSVSGTLSCVAPLDLAASTSATAGAIVTYVPVTVNGTSRKLAIYATA